MGGRGVPEGIIGGDIEADCCCVEVGLGGVEAVLGKVGFLEAHNVGMLLLCPEVDHIYSFALCGGEAADVVGEDAEARSQGPARENLGCGSFLGGGVTTRLLGSRWWRGSVELGSHGSCY
jgi:hypothetical protein